MKRREQVGKMRLPITWVLGGLALLISFVIASDDAAVARKKLPGGPPRGSCDCTCWSKDRDGQGRPLWTGQGVAGTDMTNLECERAWRFQDCVITTKNGTKKNGSWNSCKFNVTDATRNAPDISSPGERPEENEQQPKPPKTPKHAPFEKPSGRSGN
jgi:hypothetical protein